MIFSGPEFTLLDLSNSYFEGADQGFFANVNIHPTKEHLVKKTYNSSLSSKESAAINEIHTDFLNRLASIGINIPQTQLAFENINPEFRFELYQPIILQERFEPHELAKNLITNGEKEIALEVGVQIVKEALKFLTSKEVGKIGFHPTIRNYAYKDNKIWYLDTFPPITEVEKTVEYMIQNAPNMQTRLLGTILPVSFRISAEEYYDPDKMLRGIARSFCKLRPELCFEFIHKLTGMIEASNLESNLKISICNKLAKGFENSYYQRLKWFFK